MSGIRIGLRNFVFQVEQTLDVISRTLLRCLVTFMIWLSIIMAFGVGITLTIKLMERWLI